MTQAELSQHSLQGFNSSETNQCSICLNIASDFSSKDFFCVYLFSDSAKSVPFAHSFFKNLPRCWALLQSENPSFLRVPKGDVGTISHTGWEGGWFYGLLLPAQVKPLISFPNWPLMRGQQSERAENRQQRRDQYFPLLAEARCLFSRIWDTALLAARAFWQLNRACWARGCWDQKPKPLLGFSPPP